MTLLRLSFFYKTTSLDLFLSSELLRVVTLSSACGRFTETAEEVKAYHHHFQNHGHQGHHCHQGHYGHIRVVKIIVLHHYHQHCFQVVSVLEKRKIKHTSIYENIAQRQDNINIERKELAVRSAQK